MVSQSVWHWNCHYLFLRFVSIVTGIRTPNFRLRAERSNRLRHRGGKSFLGRHDVWSMLAIGSREEDFWRNTSNIWCERIDIQSFGNIKWFSNCTEHVYIYFILLQKSLQTFNNECMKKMLRTLFLSYGVGISKHIPANTYLESHKIIFFKILFILTKLKQIFGSNKD